MTELRLNLIAGTSQDLLSQLGSTDIRVPLRTEGRKTEHCERYMAARLLSTLADTPLIEYPLRVEHRDKPDFTLNFPTKQVGIECTEAVSDEWAHIDAIRERQFPDSMIMLPMLRPGKRTLTDAQRADVASGRRSGPPWVGNMAERQWADAISHFVDRKTAMLRDGIYGMDRETWLLIQDEWRVPVYRPEERMEAAQLCIAQLGDLLIAPAFSRIYVANSKWLLRLAPGPIEMLPIRNVWG